MKKRRKKKRRKRDEQWNVSPLILFANSLPQGSSPQAMSLAREIQSKLRELQNQTASAISSTERSGIRKPAPTVDGKVEQARQWLANPALDDKGLGMLAKLTPYHNDLFS